jgi:hypothetical protein
MNKEKEVSQQNCKKTPDDEDQSSMHVSIYMDEL